MVGLCLDPTIAWGFRKTQIMQSCLPRGKEVSGFTGIKLDKSQHV
jgi:hypothetical protein